MGLTAVAFAMGLGLGLGLAAAAEPAGDGVGGQTILEAQSSWRHFAVWKTELVRNKAGELVALDSKPGKEVAVRSSALPPPDWTGPDFDDSSWTREPGPVPTPSSEMALLCMRGKFEVRDPAGAGTLRLSLGFVGGAIVYLNGKEVIRKGLPNGQVEADTPAEDYPEEAYLDPDGFLYMNDFGDPGKHAERLRSRVREVRDVELPAAVLRKGVNVLAVEVRRAPASELLLTRKVRKSSEGWRGRGLFWWPRLGFRSLRLTGAAGGDAVRPNISRPAGFQVWNHPTCQRVRVTDYGDPNEPLRPVELSGPRNSVLTGLAVAGSDAPIRGLRAVAGELKPAKGGAALAASRLEVSYLLPDGPREDRNSPACFETLATSAPAEVAPVRDGGAVQPVWITLRVPRDVAAGEYAGTLAICADGNRPVEVPLKLLVHDWNLPDPAGFSTHLGLVQSPDSVALQYDVPMWSDRHWQLMERSFRLLGELGNDYVWIPVMRHTHFGNQHGMVRWIREGDGYKYDFSIAERYLDLALKHQGRPEVVCFYCWEAFTEQEQFMADRQLKGMPFTVLDPATGKLEEAWGPKWGTPEVRAFWKPVVEGFRDMLRKRGIEKSMMFGTATDAGPRSKDPPQDLAAVAPDVPWISRGHPRTAKVGSVPVGYCCYVWGSPLIPDPDVKRIHGWQNPWLECAFPRAGNYTLGALRPWAPPAMYRASLEGLGAAGLRGFGSMGADFWDVLRPNDPQRNKYSNGLNVVGRYPESQYGQVYMGNSSPFILTPGPDGARPTVRFEMIRAAAQLAEARIFIEKALADPGRRAKPGNDLAGRCQKLLDDRTRAIICGRQNAWGWFVGSGWQTRDDALYALAAEVARATAEK